MKEFKDMISTVIAVVVCIIVVGVSATIFSGIW